MSNKLFPICVVDDFYDNPYDVRELALHEKFYPNDDGRWPGARTKQIHQINSYLFNHFAEKILSIFYDMNQISNYKISTSFQKIKPFHSNKYNEINRGFIHRDGTLFGGVIYLDPDPEEMTGTSIYNFKHKWYCNNKLDNAANDIKFKKYGGDELTEDDIFAWNDSRLQYFESVRVENVFNRCILFDGNNHHGVPFFGTKERLTQVFFVEDITFNTMNGRSFPKYPLIKDSIG